MTISYKQFTDIGPHTYTPDGPFGAAGQTPFASFSPGTIVAGDVEAEYVYLIFAPVSALTLNQGDVLVWDNSYTAVQSATGAGAHPFSAGVGTFFLNGRVGDPAAAPAAGNVWSFTFPAAGVYGIWAQRAGVSVANIATVNAQSKPINTTAVAGQVNAPASALAGSMGITGMNAAPTAFTATMTTTTGSVNFTAVSTNKGFVKGMQLSGTGVATGSVILDIQGNIIVSSLAATASGTVTVTGTQGVFTCTTTNTSAVLTNVNTITGIYPNATIAGTGIPGSTTVLSISGNQAPYTVTMSAAATATANNIAVTASVYIEALLRWPYIGVQN